MIKKLFTLVAFLLILTFLITPTNARYEKTFSLNSGDIVADSITPEPPSPFPPITEYENVVQINQELQVSSGTISTNTNVNQGPITVNSWNGSITGTLTTNHNVSISGADGIKGPILRKDVTFEPVHFDYSILPTDLQHKGDFSTTSHSVIGSSGRYTNMNISNPLTIDTTNNDVFIVADYLNLGANIHVVGNNRAILLVKYNINFNGQISINYDTKHDNFDFVVESWSLNLQNNIQIYGRIYFEGQSLYMRNRIEIVGALFASKAYVELQASNLYGALWCNSLSLTQDSLIASR